MGQTTLHSVQCVLLLNVFTEKVFVILWAWYNLLSALTLLNVTTWFYALLNPRAQAHFVLNHLEMSGEKTFAVESSQGLQGASGRAGPSRDSEVQVQVERFIDKYLKTDGIFILQLIAQHADIVFTTDLVANLWRRHYEIEKQREFLRISNARWQKHLQRFETIEARADSGLAGQMPRLFGLADSPPLKVASPPSRRVSVVPRSPPELKRYHSDENVMSGTVHAGSYDSCSDDEFTTANSKKGSPTKSSPTKSRKHSKA